MSAGPDPVPPTPASSVPAQGGALSASLRAPAMEAPEVAPERGATPGKLLAVGGLVLWIALVFAAYYALHKPLPAGIAQAGVVWGLLGQGWSPAALMDAALNLGVMLWLAVLGLGSGALLLDLLLPRSWEGRLERMAFAAGLGLGCLALAFLLLGLAGGLAPLPAFAVLGLFATLALLGFKRLLLAGPSEPPVAERPEGGRLLLPLKVLLLLMAPLLLTRSLTPPVAWDSLVYHLTEPQRYIQAGRIAAGIDIPHFYFPSLVEQLFTAAMLVKGDIPAQLMHLALAGVGVLAFHRFLARYLAPWAAWLGVALLASAGSLLSLATQAYVEWGLLTFGFLAFWALHEALERRSLRWLALSACCTGFVLATKYTGVFLAAGLGLVLLWRLAHPREPGSAAFPRWTGVALWGCLAAAFASPWYLRDLALTGNPVYPFVFGGWNWDGWKAAWFSRPGTGLVTEPLRLLAAPWELAVLGAEGGAFYDATLGPLFLALAPLPVLLRSGAPWAGRALAVAAVGYASWLYGAAQSELLVQGRLLLPVLPFLAVVLAGGLTRSDRLALPFLRVGPFLRFAVLLATGLTLLTLASSWVTDPPLPYLVGAESRAAYQERHLGEHYHALSFLNTDLPPDARVFFLWEPRSYLCRVACQPDPLLYNWRYLLYRYGSAEAVFQGLRAEGYTHLLLYGGGLRFFSEPPHVEAEAPQIEELARFESSYLERLYGPPLAQVMATPAQELAGHGYAVYQLGVRTPSTAP